VFAIVKIPIVLTFLALPVNEYIKFNKKSQSDHGIELYFMPDNREKL
jgi:hypothetical protein